VAAQNQIRPMRLCKDCGYNLSKVEVGKPCPGCAERGAGKNNKHSNGRSDAITSVVLATLSIPAIFFWGIFTVLLAAAAVYLGRRAQQRSRRDVYDDITPKLAATGFIMGLIMLTLGLLVTVALLLLMIEIFTAS